MPVHEAKSEEATSRPFKELIDRAAIRRLADAVAATGRPFRRALYTRRATAGLDELELKARVRQVAAALRDALDPDLEVATQTLVEALPEPIASDEPTSEHFLYWPYLQFVEEYAATPEHFELATSALHAMTQRFSAEFAIRPLLAAEPGRTLALLLEWTGDPSPQVRRLCSEGTRPRLPWGQRLPAFIDDPHATTPILDALVDDPVEGVRRSVANHVGDIAKDHPEVAIALCRRWRRAVPRRSSREDRERLVRHALRHPIKQGNAEALALFGYGEASVEAKLALSAPSAKLGESVRLELEIVSLSGEAQDLLIDYAVHFPRADGSLAPKVFKWTERSLDGGATLRLERRHVFRRVTTRSNRSGRHRIEVLVNGSAVAGRDLEVRAPASK
ncbi:MAG: DNA alkylation repair protein [Acidobacteria bacterium]|mgnify:CR=1 FL=1|nr:MAG: DNA alkylation repair protein [Acidobacteriota bacterium]REK09162.1 MAG: DNA alkylation repair protein [Acidobacteriota bacterium]